MDMALFDGFGADFPDAGNFLHPLFASGSEVNRFHFSSPTVDREMKRLERAPDTFGRRVAWDALGDRLARQYAPIIVFGDSMQGRLYSDRVHNVVLSSVKFGPDLSLIRLDP